MRLKENTPALLDKISIYNFRILQINNVGTLQAAGIVTVTESQKHYIVFGAERLSTLQIGKTAYFDAFRYCITREGRLYGRMELSVSDDKYHNLHCLTLAEYRHRMDKAEAYLQQKYGIKVDFSDAKFLTMEINKTIIIKEAFDCYRRPLTLLMNLLPGRLKLLGIDFYGSAKHPNKANDYKKIIGTYSKNSGKRGLQIKIYDKSAQLAEEYGIETDEDYMRCEITLKSAEKIKKVLGSNSVSMVTDDMINTYFINFIEKNMVEPYAAYCAKRDIALRQTLRRNYVPTSRVWIRNALLEICNTELKHGVPLLLDIEDLIPQLDYLKFRSKQCKYSAKKRFRALSETMCDVFSGGVDKCYQEILGKLSGTYVT